MLPPVRHLLKTGLCLLAAAACGSSRRAQKTAEVAAGPACEAWRRLAGDSAFLARAERVLADTTRFADLELRIAQLMADTALYAALSAAWSAPVATLRQHVPFVRVFLEPGLHERARRDHA